MQENRYTVYHGVGVGSQSPSQSQVGSFFGNMIASVREQIEIGCFDERETQRAEEIALIIAEMYLLPDTYDVRIGGDKLPAGLVKEIYRRIGNEHVREVICRFNGAAYEIRYVKTYLRTALYNSVFEHEARLDNAVRSALGQCGGCGK